MEGCACAVQERRKICLFRQLGDPSHKILLVQNSDNGRTELIGEYVVYAALRRVNLECMQTADIPRDRSAMILRPIGSDLDGF
jgi:hypothetical protein